MILITGATSGIGLALARLYQARGEPTTLIGRKPLSDLDSSLFDSENYCQCDLSHLDCGNRIASFLDRRNVDTFRILIHNAGVGYYGRTQDQPPDSIRELVNVNLLAPIGLTKALLPKLEENRGRIVFVSSIASFLPSPRFAVYGATKSALDDFARNLRIELRDTGIGVQVVHPGPTRTDIHAKSGFTIDEKTWDRFPTAESVAAKIVSSIEGNRFSVTIGTTNSVLGFVGRRLPGFMDHAMARWKR